MISDEELSKGGIFLGLSNERYHASPGISKSGLDLIKRSPAHYKDRESYKSTPAKELGTMIHYAMLEPELFESRYVRIPQHLIGLDKRSKLNKRLWEEFEISLGPGKEKITNPQWESCMAIRDKAHSKQKVRWLLSQGQSEVSGYWIDEETGVVCKFRADKMHDRQVLVDIKSTEDASYEAFKRACKKYWYDLQGSWYLDGATQTTGIPYNNFILIGFEKVKPHAVAAYRVHPRSIQKCRELYRKNLNTYALCLNSGLWPDYDEEIIDMEIERFD